MIEWNRFFAPSASTSRRIEFEMFEAPAHLVAGQRAMAEFFLRDTDRFDVEDAIDDAEIVIDAADALFVLQVALAGAVDGLDDLLQHRVLRCRTACVVMAM